MEVNGLPCSQLIENVLLSALCHWLRLVGKIYNNTVCLFKIDFNQNMNISFISALSTTE
jgi:hypothetical protein